MSKIHIDIITCPQWRAVKPKRPISVIPAAQREIFHHTAGHHAEISLPKDESVEECMRYARDIQAFHMGPGGLGVPDGAIDSGHNFLVCRNGVILQGRWLTVSAIEAGHMVDSAHCPNQNHQVGVEHEHAGSEPMTEKQRVSSARLSAWIASQYGLSAPLPIHPHKEYFNTSCPANLVSEMPVIYALAHDILRGAV